MLMPSIFGEDLFDDFFADCQRDMKKAEKQLYGRRAERVMKTDVKEEDDGFEVIVDLPGFSKNDVKVSLENGYLTIAASKGLDKDEKEKESGRYIRKERYSGTCSRSFFVGDAVKQEDVRAQFEHGILKMYIPKKEKEALENKTKYIAIE